MELMRGCDGDDKLMNQHQATFLVPFSLRELKKIMSELVPPRSYTLFIHGFDTLRFISTKSIVTSLLRYNDPVSRFFRTSLSFTEGTEMDKNNDFWFCSVCHKDLRRHGRAERALLLFPVVWHFTYPPACHRTGRGAEGKLHHQAIITFSSFVQTDISTFGRLQNLLWHFQGSHSDTLIWLFSQLRFFNVPRSSEA